VDTPGIKEEDDDDNSQLFYHLRKASAFIYMIKTDSAGGTHKVSEDYMYVAVLESSYMYMYTSIKTHNKG
jgi:hypothetical protein